MKQTTTERATLYVTGNVQSAAIAQVLRHLPPVAERFDVAYHDGVSDLPKQAPKGSIWFEQIAAEGDASPTAPAGLAKRIAFPTLTLGMLWPFNSINPYNEPEPPEFPYGRFPYGDSFMQACIAAGAHPATIVQLYFGTAWSPSWPDLDALFKKESARLTALDARFRLGIGSYILKHFRRQRLFLTVQSPSDLLLAELTTRLLATAFPGDSAMAAANAPGVISSLGPRDCLGVLAIPVHHLVARHFELTWLTPRTRYNYFDRELLTDREYCNRFLEAATEAAGRKGTPERIPSR